MSPRHPSEITAPVAPPSSPQSEGRNKLDLTDERVNYLIHHMDQALPGEVARMGFEIRRLRARIGATAKPTEWQDIASAPKTSRETLIAISILAWAPDDTAPDGGDQMVLWWEPLMNKGKGQWYDGEMRREPTKWQPLPNAPVQL